MNINDSLYYNPSVSYSPDSSPVTGEINPVNTQQQVETSKNGNKKTLVIVITSILFLLLFIGTGVWGFFTYKKEKETLRLACTEQVTKITDLEAHYANIVTYLKNSSKSTENGRQGTNTSVLGISDINFEGQESIDVGKVLGLEDSLAVKNTREYIEMLRNALNTVNGIKEKNQEVDKRVSDLLVFGKIIGKVDLPIEETDEFVNKTEPLLTYLRDLESLSLVVLTKGYEFGAAIEETYLRGADDESVRKLEEKLNDIRSLKKDYQAIDTSGISQDLRSAHDKSLNSFDSDLKIFVDIVDAMKAKDAVALQKAFISLVSEGTAAEANTPLNISLFGKMMAL